LQECFEQCVVGVEVVARAFFAARRLLDALLDALLCEFAAALDLARLLGRERGCERCRPHEAAGGRERRCRGCAWRREGGV
jgi:hypothetical protein